MKTRTLDGRDPFEDALPGMRAGEVRLETVDGHSIRITATDQLGCDSGRRRYRVECLSCQTLVHEATTGPQHMIRGHLRDVADGHAEPRVSPVPADPSSAN